MTVNNVVFALAFFVVRVLVYWAGVYHLLLRIRPSLLTAPYSCPPLVVNTICAFISAGACLNGYWFAYIVRMARRGPPKPKAT